MKIKKILTVLTIILIISITINIVFICNKELTKTNDKENSNEFSNLNMIQKNVVNDNEQEEEFSIENSENKNTLANLEIVNEVENTIVSEKANIQEKTTTKKSEKASKKSESTALVSTPVEKEVTATQTVSISKPIEEQKAKDPTPPKKQETVVTPPVSSEEYKYNDSMTQTIISIINSNPSKYMQIDGFSVVVDSSITGLTNQFTFTQERVINKIANKAGTIKVYAQDYYYNGELLFTECYIF